MNVLTGEKGSFILFYFIFILFFLILGKKKGVEWAGRSVWALNMPHYWGG